jgi:hypothetical protein
VDLTSSRGEVGEIEFCDMRRIHDASIGVVDGKWSRGNALVNDWEGGGSKMGSTTGVGNDRMGGRTIRNNYIRCNKWTNRWISNQFG